MDESSKIARIREELALINPDFRQLKVLIDSPANLVKLGLINSNFGEGGKWACVFPNNLQNLDQISAKDWELKALAGELKLEGIILVINGELANIIPVKQPITWSEQQEVIKRFLAKLDRYCLPVLSRAKITLNQGELTIECNSLDEFVFIVENRYQVFQALSEFDLINRIELLAPNRHTKLAIPYEEFNNNSWVNFERFTMNSQINNINVRDSQRVERYRNILKGFSDNRTTVYLIDAESLIYLDVATTNPRRLNRSQDLLIGNSMDINDPSIGDPRRYWCSKAYADGENKRFPYSYHDPANGLLWHFESRVIFLPGEPNLICTVTDPIEADWQTQYWLNLRPTHSSEA